MKTRTLYLLFFCSISSALAAPANNTLPRCHLTDDGVPLAQEVTGPMGDICDNTATVELGKCEPPKSGEEAKARSEATDEKLTAADVLARLIFSESLSTGYWRQKCESPSAPALMTSIAWGILNRVPSKQRSQTSAYYNVIFKPEQFRTSFSGKKADPFAVAFLCPLHASDYLKTTSDPKGAPELFSEALKTADSVLAEFKKNGIPAHYRGLTNFFYPRSEFFGEMRPSWAPNPDPTKNQGYVPLLGSVNPCVEFYRLH
jgi:hypothetical protein